MWRAVQSLEECQSETEQWCQIIRDIAKYNTAPANIGNGKFDDLAKASEVAAYDRGRLINYKKSIMTENDWKAIVIESFEDGLEQGEKEGIKQGESKGRSQEIVQGIAKTLQKQS